MSKVEAVSGRINGIDHHDFAADPTRCFEYDRERCDEQFCPEASTLHRGVERKFGQEHSRDVLGCTTCQTRRCVATAEHVRSDCEVPNHGLLIVHHHIRAGTVAQRCVCMVSEPVIEVGGTAGELIAPVVAQGFDSVDHRVEIRPLRLVRAAARAKPGAGSGSSRARRR